MKKAFLPLLLVMLFTMSCGNKQQNDNINFESDPLKITLDEDSTLYGLACDGCTDTILVFLPINHIEANPDTFNILNASRHRRVLGQLHIGDIVAVVRNVKDTTVADIVIDMDNLQNTWRYDVLPSLHIRAEMAGQTEAQIIKSLPDSVRELLTIAKTYTLQLNSDHSVISKGNGTHTDENNVLVDYPAAKHYRQWHLLNGHLLLTETAMDSIGDSHIKSIDTTQILLLGADTLILQFKDGKRSYRL